MTAFEWVVSMLIAVLILICTFTIGSSFEQDRITKDCKLMHAFYIGSTVYNCKLRIEKAEEE
jgi:hypothetical protein